jgi:hypothetical protein
MTATALLLQQAEPNWFARLVSFLQENALGVFMVLLSAMAVAALIQWVLWSFGWGRFRNREAPGTHNLRFILTDALVKIIDDFRHLLALIIVSIFAGAIVWALAVSDQGTEDIADALQAVVSTLGGLVGSIIGYYFGEARARADLTENAPDGGVPDIEQSGPSSSDASSTETIQPAPPIPEAEKPQQPEGNGSGVVGE